VPSSRSPHAWVSPTARWDSGSAGGEQDSPMHDPQQTTWPLSRTAQTLAKPATTSVNVPLGASFWPQPL